MLGEEEGESTVVRQPGQEQAASSRDGANVEEVAPHEERGGGRKASASPAGGFPPVLCAFRRSLPRWL